MMLLSPDETSQEPKAWGSRMKGFLSSRLNRFEILASEAGVILLAHGASRG